ncbi:MAG: ABC transporter substrate-binding protein [Candidatus Binatia bacterium]
MNQKKGFLFLFTLEFCSVTLKFAIRNAKSAILCAMLFALCAAAQAQPPAKIPRVGLLRPGSPPDPYVDAFRQGLRDLGYIEGQSVAIEYRWLEGRSARLPALAAELVHLKVDVIVTQGEVMTRPVKKATNTIPIVMATSGDPVGAGLISSLARPAGNITGLSSVSADISGKRLQLLKEAIPTVSRVAMLYNPTIVSAVLEVKGAQIVAPPLGMTVQPLEMRTPADLRPAFDAMTRERADALLVQGDPFTMTQRSRILDLATKRRLPVISVFGDFVNAGGLMSYGPNRLDMFRRAAIYVDKILKGAKPADLPVEQPTKFEFVINLKAAKQIGLTIPANVLARADRVIR